MKMTAAFLLFPFLLTLPFVIRKIGVLPLFSLVFLGFWVPYNLPLQYIGSISFILSPIEFCVFAFAMAVIISSLVSPDEHWERALNNFPVLPFSLYATGGMIALASGHIFLHVLTPYAIAMARLQYVYPLALLFVCLYLIDSPKKAELPIWGLLGSMTVLGLLFLFGRLTISAVRLSDYALGSGRLSMYLEIPLLGSVEMDPAGAASLFSMAFVVGFGFWLHQCSRIKKYAAIGVVILSGAVMLKAMGRSAIIASTFASGLMWYLSNYESGTPKRLLTIIKVALFAGGIAGIVYFMAINSEFSGYKIHALEMLSNPLKSKNFQGRMKIWEQAVPIVLKYPVGIGGAGLLGIRDVFHELANDIGSTTAAHNLLLYLLLSTGFLGTIGFTLIILYILKKCARQLRSPDHSQRMLAITGIGLCSTLLVGGITTPYFHNYMKVTAFWLPIFCIIAALNLPEEKGEARNVK